MADVDAQLIGAQRVKARLEFAAKGMRAAPKLFGQVGAFMEQAIKVRVGEGKEVDGKRFDPYTPAYKAYRQEHGRPTGFVDLFFTGGMMNALTYTATGQQVRVFFMPTASNPLPRKKKVGEGGGSTANVTNAEKAYYLNEKRPFFGFSDDDVNAIRGIAEDYIQQLLLKGGKRG